MAHNKAWLYLGLVSICRVLCGFAVAKALSTLGPDQFGTISQIIGISSVFYGFAGGLFTNGLIVVVGRETDPTLRRRWLAISLLLGLAAGAILAVVAALLYKYGSVALFGKESLARVFLGIAAAQVITTVGNVFLSYASGTRNLVSFSIASITGNIGWMLVSVLATLWGGFDSAIWAVTFGPCCTAIIVIWLYRKDLKPAVLAMLDVKADDTFVLLKMSGLMVIAICSIPLAQAIIRSSLSANVGWHEVGLWQAIARLSDAYMQFFSLIIINFMLPKLLSVATDAGRNREAVKLGAALLGIFVLMSAGLYVFRDFVIGLAFSHEFLPAADYMVPQLIGDFTKIVCWVIVYRFMSSNRLWLHPAAEAFQAVALLGFYLLLLPAEQGAAPVLAYLCSTLTLFGILIAIVLRFRRIDHDQPQAHLIGKNEA